MSCDTFVVLPANDNVPVLFAKNSDREPTEAQNIVHLKRATHKAGSMVNCQRLSIKQVAETFDVVLFQPHWLWGGEMGVNEHSVCIGNEAVFTNSKFTSNKPDEQCLIGMDLLRLALERSKSAREAVDVIINLLKEHEQGGNCHYHDRLVYSSSFLIVDGNKNAFHLETANQDFAWRRIEKGAVNISNLFTIGASQCENSSLGVGVDFAGIVSDRLITWAAGGHPRLCRLKQLINRMPIGDVKACFDVLRDHNAIQNENASSDGSLKLAPINKWSMRHASVCTHAAFGPIRSKSQTTCSLVVELRRDSMPLIWTTGTAAPCLSIFKPLFYDIISESLLREEDFFGSLSDAIDDGGASMWWRHELMHRQLLLLSNTDEVASNVLAMARKYESRIVADIDSIRQASYAERLKFCRSAFSKASEVLEEQHGVVLYHMHQTDAMSLLTRLACVPLHYDWFWQLTSRKGHLKDAPRMFPFYLFPLASFISILTVVMLLWSLIFR